MRGAYCHPLLELLEQLGHTRAGLARDKVNRGELRQLRGTRLLAHPPLDPLVVDAIWQQVDLGRVQGSRGSGRVVREVSGGLLGV